MTGRKVIMEHYRITIINNSSIVVIYEVVAASCKEALNLVDADFRKCDATLQFNEIRVELRGVQGYVDIARLLK